MAHLTEIEGKGAADLDTVSPQNLLSRVQSVFEENTKKESPEIWSFLC